MRTLHLVMEAEDETDLDFLKDRAIGRLQDLAEDCEPHLSRTYANKKAGR